MEDVTQKIYQAIIANKEIMSYVNHEDIKFFDYPNANEIDGNVIVIDPLDTPTPTDFGDDDNLTYEYFYQVDVFVKNKPNMNGRVVSDKLIFLIQRIMWEQLGFGETSSVKPEYIKEFNLYHQAKRLEGKQYYKE